MKKLIKIFFLMIAFPIIVCAMQEPTTNEVEKEDIIADQEKLSKDLDKVHKKINEFWKKKKPCKRIDLTKSD